MRSVRKVNKRKSKSKIKTVPVKEYDQFLSIKCIIYWLTESLFDLIYCPALFIVNVRNRTLNKLDPFKNNIDSEDNICQKKTLLPDSQKMK